MREAEIKGVRLLELTAVFEVATGLALLVRPQLVVQLLLGAEPPEPGVIVSRVAGMALVGLGIACWPVWRPAQRLTGARVGMLAYSLLITAYLLALGLRRNWTGVLLWPAAVLHAVLSLLLLSSIARHTSARAAHHHHASP